MKRLISIFLVLGSVFIMGCKKEEKTPKFEKIKLVLDWTPNTNHTGLYVAKEKGYFEELGLDVEIIQPSQDSSLDIVAQGSAEVGISYQENVTVARTANNPLPVKAIAAIIHDNTTGFGAPKSKGIKRPRDFQGKVYGSYGSKLEEGIIRYMVEKDGGDFSKVKFVNNNATDFFAATERDIDFAWMFEAWDKIKGELLGKEVDYIGLVEFDELLNFYTPVIVTNENFIKSNPETLRKFLEGTKKGYEYAIENPVTAAEILVKNAPGVNRDLAIASQKFLADKYIGKGNKFGVMEEKVWRNFMEFLFEIGVISKKVDPNDFFTNEFLTKE